MGITKRVLQYAVLTVLAVSFFAGCNKGESNRELVSIDSLLSQKQYEAAFEKISAIDASGFSDKDKAYYSLLKTQVDYKNYIVATTDSAINLAVDYFKGSTDKEKFTRSLIYQGCVNEELGNLEKAVECYHKADDIAEDKDLFNKAFAKMRLGLLYQNQVLGAKTIAVEKLKEALHIFEKLPEKHYELVCLSEVARIYTSLPQREDSIYFYLDKSIKLAENEKDSSLIRENLFSKSQYLTEIKHDYNTAIPINKKAISINGIINHPRIHYCLAKCYTNIGKLDSALFYVNNSPQMIDVTDSMLYYDVLSEIEKAKGLDVNSREHYDKSRSLADSVLISGLNHRLLAVEKKYDTQQVELENAKLSLSLKSTLLTLSVIVITALVLLLIAIKYRHRLRDKENELDLMKADLDSSIIGLKKMQDTIAKYDQELDQTKKSYIEQLTNSESKVNRLNIEIEDAKRFIESNKKEQERLFQQIADLEEKEKNSNEMKSIIRDQMDIVHELLSLSYEHGRSGKFIKKFNSIMTVPNLSAGDTPSYWGSIQALTNDFYDNILLKVNEKTGNTLNDNDLNFIALSCWGFSRMSIMMCMGYNNLVSVSNKKIQLSKKLGVSNYDKFIRGYIEKMNSSS